VTKKGFAVCGHDSITSAMQKGTQPWVLTLFLRVIGTEMVYWPTNKQIKTHTNQNDKHQIILVDESFFVFFPFPIPLLSSSVGRGD
jgi:hypothetical protein